MADYDKDFIFYNDSDDELVDVSNGIKTCLLYTSRCV